MAQPTRIRAAVVAASLVGAGDVDPWVAFGPSDRADAERVNERLRAAGDRRRVAEAVVAERYAVTHANPATVGPRLGARFYACWMRSMDPDARARVARSLDPPDLSEVTAWTTGATAFEGARRVTASWLVAQGAHALRGLPPVRELAQLLSALRGESDVVTAPLVRWERRLRVAGRRAECEDLARALEGEA